MYIYLFVILSLEVRNGKESFMEKNISVHDDIHDGLQFTADQRFCCG